MKKHHLAHLPVILLVVVLLGGIYFAGKHHHAAKGPAPVAGPAKTAQNTTAPKSTSLQHVFVIVEENKEYGDVIGNAQAPYINKLAQTYATADNYYGVAHPSEPNYIALTSGSTNGVTSDCTPPSSCLHQVPNIADNIEKSGRTWKAYAESMPSNCYAYNTGEYATKHVPFLYYTDILNNQARCTDHVVPFTQLTTDLQSVNTTPNFAFISPNLCNDMHDCSVAQGNNWLAANVPTILNSKAFTTENSLLIITWDEGEVTSNHIPTILIGSNIKQHYHGSSTQYNHYSLLHTIEQQWKLPTLTSNDAQAPLMSEFFVSSTQK